MFEKKQKVFFRVAPSSPQGRCYGIPYIWFSWSVLFYYFFNTVRIIKGLSYPISCLLDTDNQKYNKLLRTFRTTFVYVYTLSCYVISYVVFVSSWVWNLLEIWSKIYAYSTVVYLIETSRRYLVLL